MKLAYDLYRPTGDLEQNLPPVILLHGMMDSRKTWKKLAPRIANLTGRKVYAVDARNHGESPWSDHFTFDVNAEDLDEFLTQHQLVRVAIVGHSMGGRTAAALALKKPEKVEKIVVEDINLKNYRPSQNSLIVQLLHLLRESLNHIPVGADEITAKKAVVTFIATLLSQGRDPTRNISRYDMSMLPLKRDGSSYSWETNLDAIEEMLTTEKISQTFNGVYMGDALFLYGTKSFFKVDQDILIPEFFPRAILSGFERATHLVHYEFSDRFVEEVSAFINSSNVSKAKY